MHKPHANSEGSKNLGKMYRKQNPLGLTPKIEENDSGDEEDVDEEAKLADARTLPGNKSQQYVGSH
jgi:hypothetical protein